MNDGDNLFDFDVIKRFHGFIDQIEASTGPAVLVTIGTGDKRFSTGFNLKWWAQDLKNSLVSITKLQELLNRFLTLSIPSLAVINGHAYAGGLILALTHDFRIMAKGPQRLCLSELPAGLPLPPAYTAICKSTMPIQSFRKLQWGEPYDAEEALKDNVINEVYSTQADADKVIKDFAKRLAPMASLRWAVKQNKMKMFRECLEITTKESFDPTMLTEVIKQLTTIPERMAKKAKL